MYFERHYQQQNGYNIVKASFAHKPDGLPVVSGSFDLFNVMFSGVVTCFCCSPSLRGGRLGFSSLRLGFAFRLGAGRPLRLGNYGRLLTRDSEKKNLVENPV